MVAALLVPQNHNIQVIGVSTSQAFFSIMLWKDELGGVRGPLLLGVQENKQTREEQNNRIRTIARLVSVCLVPRASCL